MRAGFTGLGLVFLFTLAASVAFAPSAHAPPASSGDKAPGEPLAQLGVAPGSEKDKTPPPTPPPAAQDGMAAPSPDMLPGGADDSPAAESPAVGAALPDAAGPAQPVEI